jgi:hypothetical protein
MKRLCIGFAVIIYSMIVPVDMLAATEFSDKLLLGELQSDEAVGICYPRVSTGSNNEIYVVWSDGDADKDYANRIYFARSLNGGLSFEEKQEIVVVTDENVYISPPKIGVDSKGYIYIIYSRYILDDDQLMLIVKKSEDSGVNFNTRTVFTELDSHIESTSWGSDIKIKDDVIYYVWSDYRDIFLARSIDGGGKFEVFEMEPGKSSFGVFPVKRKIWPSLAIDTKNNVHVVWFETLIDENTTTRLFDLYSSKLENEQPSFTESKMIAKCNSFAGFIAPPSIVVTLDDSIFVSWNKAASSFTNITTAPLYTMFSNDEGGTFSEPFEITFGEDAMVNKRKMTIDKNDAMHFLYFSSGDGTLYYTKSFDSCNSFEEKKKIDSMEIWADMCLNEKEERAYVVWYAEQAEPSGVYFSRSVKETDGNSPPVNDSGSGGGGGGCFIDSMID